MTQDRWSVVDRYLERYLLESDDELIAALAACEAAGLPPIAVSPTQGKLLFVLARSIGARRILEIGTLGGYSGIWLARALPADGRLVTLEINPDHAAVARRNFEHAGVASRVDLRVGAALDLLLDIPDDTTYQPFDLVFIDADKAQLTEYFDWSVRLARKGALIIADNVIRDGAVVDVASEDPSVQGVQRFLASLEFNRTVAATAIQTVGAKGYDGFSTAVVL